MLAELVASRVAPCDASKVQGRQDTTRWNDDIAEQLPELLIFRDSQLDMPRFDVFVAKIVSWIPRELEDLGGDILQCSGHVDSSL